MLNKYPDTEQYNTSIGSPPPTEHKLYSIIGVVAAAAAVVERTCGIM